MEHKVKIFFFCTLLLLAGCAPISDTDPPTGNILGPLIGGGAAAATTSIFTSSKPVIGIAGLAGAGLGYYLTTMRFSASGIIAAGGDVYPIGDYVLIQIPSDNLFEANTADFLAGRDPVLDSIVSVLKRYPRNNIFISASTSGFWTSRFERKMAENRAEQIASYLWAHGIKNSAHFKPVTTEEYPHARRLIYVGYGDEFPVANTIKLKGIRANSRIQIISAPDYADLNWEKCGNRFKKYGEDANIANPNEEINENAPVSADYSQYANAFTDDDHTPEANVMPPAPH